MSQVYRDHTFEREMDLGVLGHHVVEFFYDWYEPNPSNDPLQVPENGGAVIKDACLFLDQRENSVIHWLSVSTLDEIAELIREQWE